MSAKRYEQLLGGLVRAALQGAVGPSPASNKRTAASHGQQFGYDEWADAGMTMSSTATRIPAPDACGSPLTR
jgi:hypothetical protein